MPSEGIPATVDKLYDVFVRPFILSATRETIFKEWIKYNRMLRQKLGASYSQQVNAGRPLPKLRDTKIDPKRH